MTPWGTIEKKSPMEGSGATVKSVCLDHCSCFSKRLQYSNVYLAAFQSCMSVISENSGRRMSHRPSRTPRSLSRSRLGWESATPFIVPQFSAAASEVSGITNILCLICRWGWAEESVQVDCASNGLAALKIWCFALTWFILRTSIIIFFFLKKEKFF